MLAAAFEGFLEKTVRKALTDQESKRVYKELDEGAIESVVGELKKGPVPDVLTVYLSGADLYAHVAEEGPDNARRSYLVEVVDPMFAKLPQRSTRARRSPVDGWWWGRTTGTRRSCMTTSTRSARKAARIRRRSSHASASASGRSSSGPPTCCSASGRAR